MTKDNGGNMRAVSVNQKEMKGVRRRFPDTARGSLLSFSRMSTSAPPSFSGRVLVRLAGAA